MKIGTAWLAEFARFTFLARKFFSLFSNLGTCVEELEAKWKCSPPSEPIKFSVAIGQTNGDKTYSLGANQMPGTTTFKTWTTFSMGAIRKTPPNSAKKKKSASCTHLFPQAIASHASTGCELRHQGRSKFGRRARMVCVTLPFFFTR